MADGAEEILFYKVAIGIVVALYQGLSPRIGGSPADDARVLYDFMLWWLYMAGIVLEGFFQMIFVTFFNFDADREHILHWDTLFNGLPWSWSITSAGLGQTQFWTRHLGLVSENYL